MNFFAFSAMIAADAVLILFNCDILARHALNQVRTQVADLKTYQNKSLVDEGIVINHYSSVTGFHQKLVEELIAEGLPVLRLFADRQQSTQYSRSRVYEIRGDSRPEFQLSSVSCSHMSLMTTLPLALPRSTWLNASAVDSKGKARSITGVITPDSTSAAIFSN